MFLAFRRLGIKFLWRRIGYDDHFYFFLFILHFLLLHQWSLSIGWFSSTDLTLFLECREVSVVKHLVVRRLNVLLALGNMDIICLDLKVFKWQRQHNGIMEGSDALGFTQILWCQRMATFGMLNYCRAGVFELDSSFWWILPWEVNSVEAVGELLALLLEVLKI